MLEVKGVTKEFGAKKAVDNLTFKLKNGRILGIVGRNGAGKSTTFRMILKIISQTNGEILYDGREITQETLDKFGYLPEERKFNSIIYSFRALRILWCFKTYGV